MRYILFLLILFCSCHKEEQRSSPPVVTPTSTTLEYRCYCSSASGMKVNYQGMPLNTVGHDSTGLTCKSYWIQVSPSSPNPVQYFVNVISVVSSDSVRGEIWINGILKATNRDQYLEWTYYNY